jgi:HSP20 family protein
MNMALVRWNPATDAAAMEVDQLNHMFASFYGEGKSRVWAPPVDIYETEQHEVVIKAELPAMKREDISVAFENNVLTIKGERKLEDGIPQDRFHRVERFYGSFSRSFTLPSSVDAGRIAATYKDGVLTIVLPQREESKPKQIVVGE